MNSRADCQALVRNARFFPASTNALLIHLRARGIVNISIGGDAMAPFHLHYTLSRRHRLATELLPWVPAIAGTLGFTIGVTVLTVELAPWFLFLLLIPLIVYRGLVVLLFDLTIHAGQAVEILVDDVKLEMRVGSQRLSLPLDGIIQVFSTGNVWTVLHLDCSVLTIPAGAITEEQIDYLKSYARNAAAGRKAAELER
jgi:hypothetical protein